jgi:ketosteroid isomerase-like protein
MLDTTPQACLESFVAALIRKDIDVALRLLTDDVVLFYSNASAIWGKDAFATAIMANWKRIERYNYTTDDSIWLHSPTPPRP